MLHRNAMILLHDQILQRLIEFSAKEIVKLNISSTMESTHYEVAFSFSNFSLLQKLTIRYEYKVVTG